MAEIRDKIRFLLNGAPVELGGVGPNDMLLDYLRLHRRLTGTKEGCAEGDCGACTVLVGRLAGDTLRYESINACIRFLASVDGCHVVTVEHLGRADDLHPVQEAMVRKHGSQCGFCTPGIVMSLYALWMETPEPSIDDIEVALQGNLCRCTGYAPIVRAAQSVVGDPAGDVLVAEREAVIEALQEMRDDRRLVSVGEGGQVIVPQSVDDLAEVLNEQLDATIVAGATDVGLWVTKLLRPIAPVVHIGHLSELHEIIEDADSIVIGACVTYSELSEVIGEHFPQVAEYWQRIGGWQVRNAGTIGGNVANGSPIGDTPPLLIALGATVALRKGEARRTIAVEDFFIDYGKQDLSPGEFVECLTIPKLKEGEIFSAHKVSKRRDEDISSVCGAFWLLEDKGRIAQARIAYGGMAATPKRARAVEQMLIGKAWDASSVFQAQDGFGEDFAPITDMRASAEYRTIVARNLLVRTFRENSRDMDEAT